MTFANRRFMRTILILSLAWILPGISATQVQAALAGPPIVAPDDSMRLATLNSNSARKMTLVLRDGRVVSENFTVYSDTGRWFIPLGELARDLGYSVEMDIDAARFEAFTSAESRVTWLDVKRCRGGRANEPETPFLCSSVVVYLDDIYVTPQVINEILAIDLSVNSIRSEIRLYSSEGLEPIALEQANRSNVLYDPGYVRISAPEAKLDGIFVDQQLGYFSQRNDQSATNEFRHDTVLTGELFGFESSAFLSGRSDRFDRQRYTLSKHSVDGKLLGPARATEVQLIDVTFPTVPLVGGGGVRRGALVSSFPLDNPSQFGNHDFFGDLPAGWDVELYQNDTLIDRRRSERGIYEFKGIPLNFGENRFRLLFYGPQGQRREEFETYSIDSSFLRPGTGAYRLAVSDDVGYNSRLLFQYDRSLAKNLNLFSAVSRFSMNAASFEPQTFALIGGRKYVSNLLFSLSGASNDRGGTAADAAIQAPLRRFSLGVGYTRLANFLSEIYRADGDRKPRDVARANLTFDVFNTISFRNTFEGARTIYEDAIGAEFVKDSLTHRVSTVIGGWRWFNTLNYVPTGAKPLTGELATQTFFQNADTRITVGYNSAAIQSATVDAQARPTNRLSLLFSWNETFEVGGGSAYRRQTLNLTREFELFNLTSNVSVDSKNVVSAGALLSYSFGREARAGDWYLQAKPQALKGSVSVLTYRDLNRDGQHEPNEPSIGGVEIALNQQDTGVRTDARGIAVLKGLPLQQAADITLSNASFGAEGLRPVISGYRVYPRLGKMTLVEIGLAPASEIAGYVKVLQAEKPQGRRGIRVLLKDDRGEVVKSALTDEDGFYLIEDVKAGGYTLELDARQLKSLKLKVEQRSQGLSIGADASSDVGRDFICRPIR